MRDAGGKAPSRQRKGEGAGQVGAAAGCEVKSCGRRAAVRPTEALCQEG